MNDHDLEVGVAVCTKCGRVESYPSEFACGECKPPITIHDNKTWAVYSWRHLGTPNAEKTKLEHGDGGQKLEHVASSQGKALQWLHDNYKRLRLENLTHAHRDGDYTGQYAGIHFWITSYWLDVPDKVGYAGDQAWYNYHGTLVKKEPEAMTEEQWFKFMGFQEVIMTGSREDF